MWHFVYLAFEEGSEGRNYIGKHSTSDLSDGYLGSSLDPTFKPSHKIILGYYSSKEAAVLAEIQWQHVFNVVPDSSFANRAYQTSRGFVNPGGWNHSEESKAKISAGCRGKKMPGLWLEKRKKRVGKKAPAYGLRHSEETKKQMSEKRTGRKWVTDGTNQAQLEPGENPPDGWWFGRPKRK